MTLRNRTGLTLKIARATLAATLALSTTPAALGQPVAPAPRINIPPPMRVQPLAACRTDSNGQVTCSSLPTLPAPVPTPVPSPALEPQPIPASSKTALTPASPRDISEFTADRVLSYYQRGLTRIDTRKAFGFVLLPRSPVTSQDRHVHERFCLVMLASLEFMTPGAAARESAALVTYWPIVTQADPVEIEAAFASHDCPRLLAWYDHDFARRVVARIDRAGLSGPLLIVWPSEGENYVEVRDPLIIDFWKADDARATIALRYWFLQLRTKPEMWESRIREGTIRAGLAGAINHAAGVIVAVLAGKWDSVAAVNETP